MQEKTWESWPGSTISSIKERTCLSCSLELLPNFWRRVPHTNCGMFCEVNSAGLFNEKVMNARAGRHILTIVRSVWLKKLGCQVQKASPSAELQNRGEKVPSDWLLLLAIKGGQFFTAYSPGALPAPWMLLIEGWKKNVKKVKCLNWTSFSTRNYLLLQLLYFRLQHSWKGRLTKKAKGN